MNTPTLTLDELSQLLGAHQINVYLLTKKIAALEAHILKLQVPIEKDKELHD